MCKSLPVSFLCFFIFPPQNSPLVADSPGCPVSKFGIVTAGEKPVITDGLGWRGGGGGGKGDACSVGTSALVVLLSALLVLAILSIIQQSHERHRDAKDEEELEAAVVVEAAFAVTNRVVKDVIIEAIFVIVRAILDKVADPFGERPILLRFYRQGLVIVQPWKKLEIQKWVTYWDRPGSSGLGHG